jgi:hypothetical protein
MLPAKGMSEDASKPADSTPPKSAPSPAPPTAAQPFMMPDSTRLTIMMFPPYGFAWLWFHKQLDREKKIFGTIGMAIYLLLWFVLVALILIIAYVEVPG